MTGWRAVRIGGRDTEQKIGQQRLAFRDDVTFASLADARHAHAQGRRQRRLPRLYGDEAASNENPRYYFRSGISATIPYQARFGFGDPDLSANNTEIRHLRPG